MRTRFPDYSIDISNGSLRVMVVMPIALVSGLSEGVQSAANQRKVQEAIRLIADETRGGYVVCSTGQKLVSSVVCVKQYPTTAQATVQIYFTISDLVTAAAGDADDLAAIAAMTANDEFTIEMDWGAQPEDLDSKLQSILDILQAEDEGGEGEDVPEGVDGKLELIMQYLGVPASISYTELTKAEAIAIARDCQYGVMGTSWPIPSYLPTGVTEANVQSAAQALGITYHAPTSNA